MNKSITPPEREGADFLKQILNIDRSPCLYAPKAVRQKVRFRVEVRTFAAFCQNYILLAREHHRPRKDGVAKNRKDPI
jgi:hypothetical protein